MLSFLAAGSGSCLLVSNISKLTFTSIYILERDGGKATTPSSRALIMNFSSLSFVMLRYHLTFLVLKENQVEVLNRRKQEI